MSRLQERTLLVPFLSAILAASTLAAGAAGVLAGSSSRNVFYGSPGTAAPGSLTFTSANTGGATATDVIFRNNGPQTLNHIRLSGGAQVPATVNPGSPPPSGPSLPADLDYLALYASPGSTAPNCSLTNPSAGGFDGFVCNVGQLGAGQFVQFRLVVSAPTAAAARALWFSAQFNEGSSGTGSNPDVAFTSGSFTSSVASCTGVVANYFLIGQKVNLANDSSGACPTQKASIKGPSFDAQGTFASLSLDLSSTQCATGFSCFGALVNASVNNGAPGTDAIVWTIRWASSLYQSKPKGVLHFLGAGASDSCPTAASGYCVIYFKTPSMCATDSAGLPTGTNCWFGLVSTPEYTEVSFRTATNNSAKGF